MASFTQLCLCATLVIALVSICDATINGKRTLVILDDLKIKTTHSIFFKQLSDRGYKLTYSSAEDSVKLRAYGEWSYDNLVLFAPEADELSGLPLTEVLDFIDSGHNVLVAASSSLSDPVREIASECNVEFDDTDTFVIDHFNFDTAADTGDHTVLVADHFVKDAPVILGKEPLSPVLFKGVSQDIEEDSQLLFSILSGSDTAYSANPAEPVDTLHVAGKKTVLFSVLQTRGDSRVGFSGSLDLFSDKFINSPVTRSDGKKLQKSGNEQFIKQVVSWIFQERGVLVASEVNHHRVGETEVPATYTIKENVTYSVKIEEYDGVTGKFVPFKANDVQLEFRMLDPYVRVNLKPNDKGIFSTTFTLPDVYGIFTFRVEYVRKGYNFLTSITRVPVRPFRHNQYERFIPSAFPYYAGATSMLGGLFLFSWVFLYHRERK